MRTALAELRAEASVSVPRAVQHFAGMPSVAQAHALLDAIASDLWNDELRDAA